MRASAILRLARTTRCAIVGSGTRNGGGDLAGGQAADDAQGERDLGVLGERRVAAEQHELELVVGQRAGLVRVRLGPGVGRRSHGWLVTLLEPEGVGLLAEPLALPADPVDRPVAGHRRQPGGRVGRHPVDRPALQRLDARLLERVLGQVQVAEAPDQPAEHPHRLGAEQVLEGRAGVVHAWVRPTGTAGPDAPRCCRRGGRRGSARPSRAPRRGSPPSPGSSRRAPPWPR